MRVYGWFMLRVGLWAGVVQCRGCADTDALVYSGTPWRLINPAWWSAWLKLQAMLGWMGNMRGILGNSTTGKEEKLCFGGSSRRARRPPPPYPDRWAAASHVCMHHTFSLNMIMHRSFSLDIHYAIYITFVGHSFTGAAQWLTHILLTSQEWIGMLYFFSLRFFFYVYLHNFELIYS